MQSADLSTMTVELTFSSEQVTQLDEVARAQQLILTEAIQLAVGEWLEKQYRLLQARTAMRKLGQGLGAGQPPHDGAQNHDAYLLTRFLALKRTNRLDSVERHRQWQASLDRTEFYDQLFHA